MYLFLYFFNFFLSNSKTLNFWSHFSVRPTKFKLDTHIGQGLIYCVHQIQAARIYLFLYFSSFFYLSNLQRLKNYIYKIVSAYLWWLRPGYVSYAHSLLYFSFSMFRWSHLSQSTETPTKWHNGPGKTQIRLHICTFWSSLVALWLVMDWKLLHADKEDRSDCLDAWADLSLHWAYVVLQVLLCPSPL